MNLTKAVGIFQRINGWIGKALPPLMLLITAIILYEVIARYAFNAPTLWAHETVQLVFGLYAVLSGGYILNTGGHINVDIIYGRFSKRGRAIADILTFPFFFIFAGVMLYFGVDFAIYSLRLLEHSGSVWDPPVYPFKLMVPIGAFLLLAMGIIKLFCDISIAICREKRFRSDEKESM
jgi:TRAP-type mannitol/chloroaromatic compound transport system permease small subunit